MDEMVVGGVRYRIVIIDRDGQHVAHAERADNGDRFGIDCAGVSREDAAARLQRWLEWQYEHVSALAELQKAEHAYHRTIAGSAFASPGEGPSADRDAEGVARSARGRPSEAGRDPHPPTRLRQMRLKKTYSSREVAAMTGLSARQLQLWDASGLLSPAIPSHRTAAGGYTERRYTPIELFELLVMADLRQQGLTVPQLHAIVATLKDQFGVRLFDATGGGGAVQLLTDGRDLYARTSNGEFFNMLRTPAQPLLVVGNEGLLKELSGKIKPRRKKRPASGSGKSSRGRRTAAG